MNDAQAASRQVPRELEIKLDLTPIDAAMLEASLAAALSPDRIEQRAIYFDTPDGLLRRAGLTLRIRETEGCLVQTVKTWPDGAGLFDRAEWEKCVAAPRPVIDPRVTGITLDSRLLSALAPAFEIRVLRHRWAAVHHGGIELAIDQATIVAADREARFAELECELKHAGPDAAFALVRRLAEAVPLRLGVSSKAERGFRLLGAAQCAFKAEPLALGIDMTSRQAFVTIMIACLRHYRLNESILLERREPEAVHQARVALRRLRSALALFDVLLDDRARAFDAALQSLARTLGDARDLDVVLGRDDCTEWEAALLRRRDAAYDAVEARLRTEETRALFVDIAAWLASDLPTSRAGAEPIVAFAGRALAQEFRKLARRSKGFVGLSPARRHRVRKAAKRLHYANDFFAATFAPFGHHRRIDRFGNAVDSLQDKLGALNDRAVHRTIVADLAGGASRDARTGTNDTRLLKSTKRALDRVLDARRYWH